MRAILGWLAAMVLALACTPSAARTVESYNVAGWRLSALANDKTGRFESCIASAEYNNGFSLFFYIDDEYVWSVGLSGGRIRVVEKRTYGADMWIDNGRVHHFNAVALSDHTVSVILKGNVPLFQELRLGNTLHISVAGQFAEFHLDGTARMMLTLLECVRHYRDGAPEPEVADAPEPDRSTPARTSAADPPRRGAVSTGSGFFVTPQGIGLTNAHVVAGCNAATITGYGPARILARDTVNDLALVRLVHSQPTPIAKIRRRPLQLGETVYVMGFPLAGQLDNGLNFTSGLVSSLAGMGNDTRLLQFTAPIQPGNSGGPIVDDSGLIIGVIQSKLSEIAALKESGSLPQNINFGIKADLAANFVRSNGAEASDAETAPPRPATAIAQDGRGFTFQISCVVE